LKKFLSFCNVCFLILLILSINTDSCFAAEYSLSECKNIINPHKTWTVKFNSTLNPLTINNKNIYVTDSKGTIVKTDAVLQNNLKSISISTVESKYKINENYYLNIGTAIQSQNGKFLSKPIKMPFMIENTKSDSYINYTVTSGDTLWKISKKFNTTVNTIKSLNNLDTNSIRVNQKLLIPGNNKFKLGDDVFIDKYHYLIDGKKVGLITNQTGVNSRGKSIIEMLSQYTGAQLTALYGPEHGIDGQAQAGAYVKSYTHPKLNIPVYSLYGANRMPSEDMLSNIDVLVFDIQDIGTRSYTFKSTLHKCMEAAKTYNKEIIVLDRPNPLGGQIFDGPVLEDKFESFVGIDNIPMTHGMTMGELAQFFNREINVKLSVVPMEGYNRNMIFQETGLKWVQSSPYMPDIDSVFCYAATGLGVNTTVHQADYFKWVGSNGLKSDEFANLLNNAKLPGVKFIPETRGNDGGVRLKITDYHTFNPGKTGIYVLAYSRILKHYNVPKSGTKVEFFDKIMGTAKIGECLEKELSPKQIEATYKNDLEKFKIEREKYLIYN
jgi:uncharacterized protein YbbC (DUF1343 family)